jgi:hypothetical protein
LIAAAAIGAAIAVRYFETVWLAVLTLLPLIRLSGGLFGYNGVTLSRILVTALALVFLLTLRDANVLRALAKSNGLRFFGLFVLVNLVSAVYVLKASAVFTTLTYLEPLFFFAISYGLIRLERITLRALLRAILLGAVLVAVGGLLELAMQQPLGASFNPRVASSLDVYMSGYDSNRFGLGGRVSSFIAHPVFAGLYWVMLLNIGVYYLQTWKRARSSSDLGVDDGVFRSAERNARRTACAGGGAMIIWIMCSPRAAR